MCGCAEGDAPVAGPVDRKLSPSARALFAQHLCAGTWVLRDLVHLLDGRGASFVRRRAGFKQF